MISLSPLTKRKLQFGNFSSASPFAPRLAEMPSADGERLKERLRARLEADARGRITYAARANAVRGRRPG